MMDEFISAIKEAVEEESNDKEKYTKLAAIAPCDKARRILTDISAEEHRHHDYLTEILHDAERHKNTAEIEQEQAPDTEEE